jgi:hypothetical protein
MLVELRIQFDRLELFLPIGLRRLERHIVGRVGGGLLVGHRVDGSLLLDGVGDGNVVGNFLAVVHGDRNTPRAVAENRCDLPFIPNANPENPNCERPLLERFAPQTTRVIARVAFAVSIAPVKIAMISAQAGPLVTMGRPSRECVPS